MEGWMADGLVGWKADRLVGWKAERLVGSEFSKKLLLYSNYADIL